MKHWKTLTVSNYQPSGQVCLTHVAKHSWSPSAAPKVGRCLKGKHLGDGLMDKLYRPLFFTDDHFYLNDWWINHDYTDEYSTNTSQKWRKGACHFKENKWQWYLLPITKNYNFQAKLELGKTYLYLPLWAW